MRTETIHGKILFVFLVLCLLLPASSMAGEIRRVDENGYLYYMDYTGDYYSTEVFDSL